MLCFLDTEFTRFKRPALISLALVTEAGHEFYAERNDFPTAACSDFVRQVVMPLLGRMPGAACTLPTLKTRLRQWFASLPEPVTVVYDFKGDGSLLAKTLAGASHPDKIARHMLLDYPILEQPTFARAQSLAYTAQWPRHHALADARALRAACLACGLLDQRP